MRNVSWLVILLVFSAVSGCSRDPKPPVEVLYADVGRVVEEGPDGVGFTKFNAMQVSSGDRWLWRMFIRTNKPTVVVTQKMTMAAMAAWDVPSEPEGAEKFEISDDGRTATVTETKDATDGFVYGVWEITESDPVGPVSVTVTIDEKVKREFSFEIQPPKEQ